MAALQNDPTVFLLVLAQYIMKHDIEIGSRSDFRPRYTSGLRDLNLESGQYESFAICIKYRGRMLVENCLFCLWGSWNAVT